MAVDETERVGSNHQDLTIGETITEIRRPSATT